MIGNADFGSTQALLRAQLIRHGDSIRHAPWWPKTRRGHEAALAACLGLGRVSIPRLRLGSVKPKPRGEQAAAGGCGCHRAAPDGASGDEAALFRPRIGDIPVAFPQACFSAADVEARA